MTGNNFFRTPDIMAWFFPVKSAAEAGMSFISNLLFCLPIIAQTTNSIWLKNNPDTRETTYFDIDQRSNLIWLNGSATRVYYFEGRIKK